MPQLSALRYLGPGVLLETTDELAGRGLPSQGKTVPVFCHDPHVPGKLTGITVVWIRTPPTQTAGIAGGNQEGVGFPPVARVRASHSFM